MAYKNSIEIQKNIPIPVYHACKYNIEAMETGDSFLVPSGVKYPQGVLTRTRKKFPEREFIGKTTGEGYRIWCIDQDMKEEITDG